ncbi:hypothetical protein [Natrialba sp. INN-245]|uniref:hypothetical protein n=1 Tax=Natrialba sp. INN-245 TaxID=2690967 RepID=UPI0013111D82|nr:hypothetical protein [Natrialba sp. INN-245]MWV38821.1 hypothetical protein [Natrialba sp. INN-245]
MELSDERLSLSRTLSELDQEVIEFTRVLNSCDVNYVIVSGYVAILTGRSRATEDIDVILEPLSKTETEQLVSVLKDSGYWGMAMPLDDMYSLLSDEDRIRIAEDGEMFPNFETWFVSNDLEREALDNALTVEFDDSQIAVSPIELQIAYKLRLAQQAGSLHGKYFEDALHLYFTFEEQFNTEELEVYVTELGVEDYYAELKRA